MNDFQQLETILKQTVPEGELIACYLSKVRNKQKTLCRKVSIRPLKLRGSLHYQFTYHYPAKELHENLDPTQARQLILYLLQKSFRQGMFFTVEADWQVLVSKRGSAKILKKPPSRQLPDLSHDRKKNYFLQEGTPYPFLVELGVMNKSGKVLAKYYHKFRQLNKYLEIVSDCLPALQDRGGEESLTVIDFGSGRAYLTFALYHYLVNYLELEVEIIGLDLKEDVVAFCNKTAARLGYGGLKFYHRDIRDFEAEGKVDVVVSLHACDTATDFALAQAVKWRARLILAVPCCQQEAFAQIEQAGQSPILEHGILKERMAALVTDAARAKLLEAAGYSTTIMEFIDLEHTPKNLLIRASRAPARAARGAWEEYLEFKRYWHIEPTLESLFEQERLHS